MLLYQQKQVVVPPWFFGGATQSTAVEWTLIKAKGNSAFCFSLLSSGTLDAYFTLSLFQKYYGASCRSDVYFLFYFVFILGDRKIRFQSHLCHSSRNRNLVLIGRRFVSLHRKYSFYQFEKQILAQIWGTEALICSTPVIRIQRPPVLMGHLLPPAFWPPAIYRPLRAREWGDGRGCPLG